MGSVCELHINIWGISMGYRLILGSVCGLKVNLEPVYGLQVNLFGLCLWVAGQFLRSVNRLHGDSWGLSVYGLQVNFFGSIYGLNVTFCVVYGLQLRF